MRTTLLGAAMLSLALPFAPLGAQDHAHAHGRLGVMLGGTDPGADSAGARVRAVMPDSPADAAGLRRGDVITRLNGTPLDGSRKLVELARGLQPGDTVRLEYRRDGATRTATLVADRMESRIDMSFREMPGPGRHGEGMGPGIEMHMPGMDMHMMMFRHHAGLELVEMGKDLGEYFGTSEGYLVVKPPADSASPLKAGDVIMAIDGRKPQSVEHAFEILHSYAPGEKAKFDVMRKKQRTTLTWVAPARHPGREWRGRMERSEGPEPADLFEMQLPALESFLGSGET
ncbi:MAG TPA: PDZ domain-containing protein [Gemmatimonadales bacterium]|nr:PDZ domain-containing protein [Gemmatimonadales bacterium]